MSQTRIVALFWIGATFCIGIVLEHVVSDLVLGALRLGDPTLFFDWRLSTIAGFSIAIVVGIATFLRKKLKELAYEVAAELKKVTWPTRVETQRQTFAVLAFAAIFAGILGIFDTLGAKVMTAWLPRLISAATGLGR